MIDSLDDLNHLPALLVTYESGSSGEFFGSALCQSFDVFAKQSASWVGENRVLLQDFFGKRLASGDLKIDSHELLNEVNYQLNQYPDTVRHIGLVHPRPQSSIDFVNQYMPNTPMIQIVCYKTLSKKFRTMAADAKLRPGQGISSFCFTLPNEMAWADQFVNPVLKVEWGSLFLTNTESEFQRIANFVGHPGDIAVFRALLQEYLDKNKSLLVQCQVDQ